MNVVLITRGVTAIAISAVMVLAIPDVVRQQKPVLQIAQVEEGVAMGQCARRVMLVQLAIGVEPMVIAVNVQIFKVNLIVRVRVGPMPEVVVHGLAINVFVTALFLNVL